VFLVLYQFHQDDFYPLPIYKFYHRSISFLDNLILLTSAAAANPTKPKIIEAATAAIAPIPKVAVKKVVKVDERLPNY